MVFEAGTSTATNIRADAYDCVQCERDNRFPVYESKQNKPSRIERTYPQNACFSELLLRAAVAASTLLLCSTHTHTTTSRFAFVI